MSIKIFSSKNRNINAMVNSILKCKTREKNVVVRKIPYIDDWKWFDIQIYANLNKILLKFSIFHKLKRIYIIKRMDNCIIIEILFWHVINCVAENRKKKNCRNKYTNVL